MTLPELIRRWQYGWGLAKGLAPAETITGSHNNAVALKVTLDLPGRYQELVPLDAEHGRYFAGVVARAAQPSWVSVVGSDPAAAVAEFKAAGLVQRGTDDSLMTIALAEHPVHEPPAGYTVETAVADPVSHKRTLDENASWDGSATGDAASDGATVADEAGRGAADGDAASADPADTAISADQADATEPGSRDAVIRVRVLDADGKLAARGLMGVHGTDAVAHGIMTEPDHRRRGLGSVVMSALSREAIALGADTGLLVAVPEGQFLYQRLGWSDRGAFVTGALPSA